MTFYVILPMQGAVGTVTEAFGGKKALAPLLSAGVNLIMLILVYLFHFHTSQVIRTITGTLFWIFPAFTVLLPLLLLLVFGRRPYEKIS